MNRPAEPIRVMHVLPWVTSGGVEKRRVSLARGLDPSEFRQRVVCLESRPAFVHDLQEAGVPVITTGRGSTRFVDPAALKRIADEAKIFRPDIIHGAVFEGVTMAVVAGKLAKVPRVVIEETGDPAIRSWRGDALLALLARFADVAVGVSPPITDYLLERLRLPESRVRLIRNGVQPPDFSADDRETVRQSLGIDGDAFVIGTVGRIDNDHKRFTDLIDSFSIVAKSQDVEDAHLVIVGTGRDLEMLRTRASERGIAERVHFTGFRNDVGRIYAALDLFALSSRQESFGLVLVEAMFCGLPVVATRVGGIPSIVIEGETGRLVEPFDTESMARRLLELATNSSLRRRLGENGRRRAFENFTEERYVADVARLYRDLSR